jgi:hypothetical protein
MDQGGRTDLDLHADTCVLGSTFHIYEDTAQQCTVYPYSTKYKPKIVTIAHGGTAYDHSDGKTYILDVNNGFNMINELSTSLLQTNFVQTELLLTILLFTFPPMVSRRIPSSFQILIFGFPYSWMVLFHISRLDYRRPMK